MLRTKTLFITKKNARVKARARDFENSSNFTVEAALLRLKMI